MKPASHCTLHKPPEGSAAQDLMNWPLSTDGGVEQFKACGTDRTASHFPLLQTAPLRQSVPVLHSFPAAHLLQTLPPQSTSVSSWFASPSEHVGRAHILLTPAGNHKGWVGCQKASELGHLACLFWCIQETCLPVVLHDWLMQSPSTKQCMPVAQAGQTPPPQLRSVSGVVVALSLHVLGTRHTPAGTWTLGGEVLRLYGSDCVWGITLKPCHMLSVEQV